MTDATELSDQILNLQRCASRKAGSLHRDGEPRQSNNRRGRAPASPHQGDGTPVLQQPRSGIAPQRVQTGELDRLHRSLSEVTPENHPRTARLLASSTRKIAQKVFEEAGEVALEAVKHRTRGVVRESADLLYHLVALWHRAGIDPTDVWIEMRLRADTLGIAEKPPKARREDRRRPIHVVKQPLEGNGP